MSQPPARCLHATRRRLVFAPNVPPNRFFGSASCGTRSICVRAPRCMGRAGASHLGHVSQLGQRTQIAFELGRGLRVDVVQAQLADAEYLVKGDRLELALGTVADQGHAVAVRPGQCLAARADIAAVLSAVVTVSSESRTG